MIRLSGRIATAGVLALTLALAVSAGPAAAQTLAIEGGTVHPVSGASYTGTVVVRDGVIEAAGPDVAAPRDVDVSIDADGLHVYPGLFNAWTVLGLVEIDAISATVDQAELGDTPHLLAVEGVHPASEIIPVTRENGITHALTAPGGGPWAGQASVILLDGWTVEEMEVEKSVGVVVEWPSLADPGVRFLDLQRPGEEVLRGQAGLRPDRGRTRRLDRGGAPVRPRALECRFRGRGGAGSRARGGSKCRAG